MVEPFVSRRGDGGVVNDLSTPTVITSVAIASALGATSAYTWLKLPVTEEMKRVVATTLPTVLLGGDPHEAADAIFAKGERALGLPGVRGLVAGRALLYPPDGNVEAAVDIAAHLVRATAAVETRRA